MQITYQDQAALILENWGRSLPCIFCLISCYCIFSKTLVISLILDIMIDFKHVFLKLAPSMLVVCSRYYSSNLCNMALLYEYTYVYNFYFSKPGNGFNDKVISLKHVKLKWLGNRFFIYKTLKNCHSEWSCHYTFVLVGTTHSY